MARKTVKRKQTRNRKNKNAPSWSENEAAVCRYFGQIHMGGPGKPDCIDPVNPNKLTEVIVLYIRAL
jgi:hypothetical protein